MKVLAVGDIHTKLWIVDEVRKIADNYDAVVFVGDYADDWGVAPIVTIQTWKELRSLSHSNPKVKLVQGNHDYVYTNYTKSISSGYNPTTQLLLDTPENEGLKEWLHNLPIILELDGVSYSHAGLTETWGGDFNPVSLWQDDSPIWVRPDSARYKKIPQVFGHTPSKTCWEVEPNIWCIDTFSTYSNGKPVGDGTVLKVTDGKQFEKVKLKDGNNSPTSIKD